MTIDELFNMPIFQMKEWLKENYRDPKGEYKGTQYDYGWNIDGYPASEMYTYIQNDIYNALPTDLKNSIITNSDLYFTENIFQKYA